MSFSFISVIWTNRSRSGMPFMRVITLAETRLYCPRSTGIYTCGYSIDSLLTSSACPALNREMVSLLVEFQGLIVGVIEEDETLAGVVVDANSLVEDTQGVELGDGGIDVIDFKCEMPQSCSLGAGHTLGRIVEREQFYHILAIEGKVGLVATSLGAVILGLDGKAQQAGVEVEAALVVGADDGDVMNFVELQHGSFIF